MTRATRAEVAAKEDDLRDVDDTERRRVLEVEERAQLSRHAGGAPPRATRVGAAHASECEVGVKRACLMREAFRGRRIVDGAGERREGGRGDADPEHARPREVRKPADAAERERER